MKTIKHSLHFITEVDENNPTAKQLLELDSEIQIHFLESMLKDLLAPALGPVLDEVNKGNSWATLKVAE
jgi:hypothetical protein